MTLKRAWLPSIAAAAILIAFTISGCPDGGVPSAGITPTQPGSGPVVVFDPAAKPVPEIPFPNDLATVRDASSPTGKRLNISTFGPTDLEEGVRGWMNQLDGFGTYSPISTRFTGELDIDNIRNRHASDMDFADDAVYVFNLDTGEPVPLDMGNGNFPLGLPLPHGYVAYPFNLYNRHEYSPFYFKNDYRYESSNLMFETEEEDVNCNGLLDPGEDTDYDGVLDHPNAPDPERFNPACPEYERDVDKYDDILTFYEFETDTLVIRTIMPLDEQASYAVVLTNRLTGKNGDPVRSPFPYANHSTQTDDLAPLEGILPAYDLRVDDVAFAWVFTTQTVTADLIALREGVNGAGPYASLGLDYPPVISGLSNHGADAFAENMDCEDPIPGPPNYYLVDTNDTFMFLMNILAFFSISGVDLSVYGAMVGTYEYVDYIAQGTFTTPDLIANEDGLFRLDPETGTVEAEPDEATFWLVMPKKKSQLEIEGFQVPHGYPEDDEAFPVVFYGHGYSTGRTEALAFAGMLAKFGLSTIGMDAPHHGPLDDFSDLGLTLMRLALDLSEGNGENFHEALVWYLSDSVGIPSFLAELLYGTLYEFVFKFLAEVLVVLDPDYDCITDVEDAGLHDPLDPEAIITAVMDSPFLYDGMSTGRAVDVNGDGLTDSGADFWSAKSFHTRDIVRQGVIDHFQMIKVMKSWNGATLWNFDMNANGIADDLAGDFDGDGGVDMGGPEGEYFTMGQSLGAFFSTIQTAMDPDITAGSPVSAGAGLGDLGLRTTQDGVFQAVYLEVFGPMVIGGRARYILPDHYRQLFDVAEEDRDRFVLAFDHLSSRFEQVDVIEWIDDLEIGDMVTVRNLRNGEVEHGGVRNFTSHYDCDSEDERVREYLGGCESPALGFRVPIPSDVGDDLEIEIIGADGEVKALTHYISTHQGYGHRRNSPDTRRFLSLSQMVLGPADPAAYAPFFHLKPLEGLGPRNILIVHSIGDTPVPIASGVAQARAAGFIRWDCDEDFECSDDCGCNGGICDCGWSAENPCEAECECTDAWHPEDQLKWACDDPRGPSMNQALIDHYVVEGLLNTHREDEWGGDVCGLWDPSNLSQSLGDDDFISKFGCTPPRFETCMDMRPTVARRDGEGEIVGMSGARFPYTPLDSDMHGVDPPFPNLHFDVYGFTMNQIGAYFYFDGKCITDDPCLRDVGMEECDWLFNGSLPEDCQ